MPDGKSLGNPPKLKTVREQKRHKLLSIRLLSNNTKKQQQAASTTVTKDQLFTFMTV